MSGGPKVEMPSPGDQFSVEYPFIRDTFDELTEDGPVATSTWRPGVRFEDADPYGEDVIGVADAVGRMILTVVSVHKPGRFPTRVFFTRQFVSPQGRKFGKGNLRVATAEAFCRRATRYQHPFFVDDQAHPPIHNAQQRS